MNYKNISQTFDKSDKQQKIAPHCDPVSRLLGMYEKDFDEDPRDKLKLLNMYIRIKKL